ncbi:MAG: hypothetical protein R2731_05620 [Nocardioides sp.]
MTSRGPAYWSGERRHRRGVRLGPADRARPGTGRDPRPSPGRAGARAGRGRLAPGVRRRLRRPGLPLRRAVTAYLDQDADLPLVVRTDDLEPGLAALADAGVTLLVVAPSLLRGREAEAHAWCEQHRGLLLLDCPGGVLPPGLGANAAGYTPRLRDARGRRVWTAAAVAGVVRRLDALRGLARPAGAEAELAGVSVDPAPVAPAANLVRDLPGRRPVVWGRAPLQRTRSGATSACAGCCSTWSARSTPAWPGRSSSRTASRCGPRCAARSRSF